MWAQGTVKLSPLLCDALSDFRRRLEERFAGRLRELALFGSRARGEAHEESDADVLVSLDTVSRADFVAVTDLVADILLAHGLLIDPYLVSASDLARYREQQRPLVVEFDRDGVML